MFFEPSFLYHLELYSVYVTYTFTPKSKYLKNSTVNCTILKRIHFTIVMEPWPCTDYARDPLTIPHVERIMNMTDNVLVIGHYR